jgi:hypothetical protein
VACIDDSAWFLKASVVLFSVVLGGDFRSPLLVVFLGCFRDLALGDLMGEICGNPSWFFGL